MPKDTKIKTLECKERYVYNRVDDIYIINVVNRVKPLVMPGYKVRAIRQAISNGISPSQTAADICLKFKLSEQDFDGIKKAFDLSRDAFPITDERVMEESVEQNVDTILQERRTLIAQAVEKESWKNTQADALEWRFFQNRELDPFQSALDSWNPKVTITIPENKFTPTTDNVFVVVLTDTHGGGGAEKELMQKGEWNKEKFLEFFAEYKRKIEGYVKFYSPKSLLLLGLGDIFDGLRGQTEKGTLLDQELTRDAQFDLVFNAVVDFVGFLLSFGIDLDIHNCRGNHDGVTNYTLFEAVRKIFTKQKNLKSVNNYKTPFGVFKVKNTMFIITHGDNDIIRSKVPTGDSPREAYFQRLIIQNSHFIDEKTNIVALQGDLHCREKCCYSSFDFHMVGSPSHSLYASRLNLYSRPSQTCFVLTDKGFENEICVFFD